MADSLCSTSASCSMETLAESREERRSLEEKRFVIINNCCERHPKLLGAVKQYGLPVFYSESGMDFARDADYDTVFVTDNFNDGTYFRLRGEEVRIAGPPVVISSASKKEHIPFSSRPLYCTSMQNLIMCFTGFKQKAELVSHSGRHVPAGDSDCTHLVIDHSISSKNDIPFETHHKLNMVTGEWFWASIQMEACAEESMYQFEKIEKTPSSAFNTPSSGSRMRKRKRLKDTLTQLASDGELDSPIMYHKRRSSEHMLSLSASLIDVTPDVATPLGLETATPGAPTANISKRKQVIMELLQTENNYVAILDTVLTIFKEGIENPNQPGGPLLPPTDVKLIFGTIPSIFQIHSKICEELASLVANWREECSVGDVIVRHASELTKAYPPFVNFFEQTKATIEECDRTNTRFHAFLMVCKNKPECCRQTLKELLIRPVQRLPSVVLLLNDIKKHTNKNFSDYAALEKAVNALNEVLKHINEDKRKTEGQVAMFEVVNDIENCPPNLLSSHRSYITKVDVIDLSTELRGKGDALTLYLFSDSLEICRRRRAGNFKSPAPSKTPQKPYKHIEMLPLASVKRVADITDGEDCKNVFSLICRSSLDAREKLYSFSLCTDGVSKEEFLQTLCKGIASTTCKTDWESLLVSLDAKMLDIAASDPGKQVLKRFGKRVSRAFSFNKTPRKLKRALSSMSPFVKENHHAQDKDGRMPCTPRQELGMRLATSDLNDFLTPNVLPLNMANKKKIKSKYNSASSISGYLYQTLRRAHSTLSVDDIADSPLQSYPSTPSLVHKFNTIGPADSRKLGL
ncbi:protein ECT2-like [Lingula anatina]|uniref:Protein ECT2-like n=1 Tax=Lingula anatina TaxID=7574 RepID=A0A1S3HVL5_LINAN|nr:protein ECT2-like [Lingula anatina]|eukprot:XP_013390082.1 protein ECT2-like [Lingula anatina]